MQKGDYEEAEALHRHAVEGLEKALGLEHQDTLNSMFSLAQLLILTGGREEAQDLIRRYYMGAEKNLGRMHWLAETMVDLALWLW